MAQLSFQDFFEEDKYYSVTEFTREIKFLLESTFPHVWVKGEISNFKHHSSGHMYFSLKDENSQIDCAYWRSRNWNLTFAPQDGMKVLINARLSLYEKRGSYQLDVIRLQPAGIGELQIAFDQLKNRLYEEGLFAVESKKPIPKYPESVGIITSPTGAAIQDFVTVLRRRFPAVERILKAVHVQGDGAAKEIVRAIDEFNDYGKVDVLVICRGGGSLEDLWAFNEETVARAVFRSKIPVVSAVGHEVDFSICDFVADLRAPTPSAAAEMIVCDREEVKTSLNNLLQNIKSRVNGRVNSHRDRLGSIANSYAFRQPVDLLTQYNRRLDELDNSLNKSLLHKIEIDREILHGFSKRLSLLEHNNVLKRGYSLCFRRADGKIVKNSKQLTKEDEIELSFYKGKAVGIVNEVLN